MLALFPLLNERKTLIGRIRELQKEPENKTVYKYYKRILCAGRLQVEERRRIKDFLKEVFDMHLEEWLQF